MRTFRGHPRNISGKNIQGIFRKPLGNFQGTVKEVPLRNSLPHRPLPSRKDPGDDEG
jgi:hypothetical protein